MESKTDIAIMDATTLLDSVFKSKPEIASLLRENLPYIAPDKIEDALYYAAMGKERELLDLLQYHCQ